MRRFFFDPASLNDGEVLLAANESHHITKVLRLQPGTEIELLDGQGTAYRARVTELGRSVRVQIVATHRQDDASVARLPLIVGQGIVKGKMDFLVEKCTELGVATLIPFWSSRCQGKLAESHEHNKTERYRRIVVAACKQCARLQPMTVSAPLTFAALLAAHPPAEDVLRLLFWEEEREVNLHHLEMTKPWRQVVILLGPEGGFAAEEVQAARASGWQTVSLGGRVLRAETATLAAVAIVQFFLGNM